VLFVSGMQTPLDPLGARDWAQLVRGIDGGGGASDLLGEDLGGGVARGADHAADGAGHLHEVVEVPDESGGRDEWGEAARRRKDEGGIKGGMSWR